MPTGRRAPATGVRILPVAALALAGVIVAPASAGQTHACDARTNIGNGWQRARPPQTPANPLPVSEPDGLSGVHLPPSSPLQSLAVVAAQPRTWLTTDGASIFRTTDAGCSWSTVYTIGEDGYDAAAWAPYVITRLVTPPYIGQRPSKVAYAVLSPGSDTVRTANYANSPPTLIMVSDNAGASWSPAAPSGVPSSDPPNCLGTPNAAVSPVDPRVLLLACGSGIARAPENGRTGTAATLYRSPDGGGSWSQLALPPEVAQDFEPVPDPTSPTGLYLLIERADNQAQWARAEVWRTADLGVTWTHSSVPGRFPFGGEAPVVLRTTAVRGTAAVVVAGWQGVYRSADAGRTWHRILAASSHATIMNALASGTTTIAVTSEGYLCSAAKMSTVVITPGRHPRTSTVTAAVGRLSAWDPLISPTASTVTLVGLAQLSHGSECAHEAPQPLVTFRAS